MKKTQIACALAAALMLQGGSAFALGLLQAYEAALQNDPTYRAAVHENEAGQQNTAIGRSTLLPSLSANYSQSKNRADNTAPNFLGQETTTHPEYTSKGASLQLRQPILNLEGIARYQQGIAQTNYSDALFSARSKDLILRLVGAYADAQYAEDQLALAIAQRDTFAEQMRVNERMFQRGEGTRTDVLETQAKFDVAEAQVIEARDNVTTARNTLAAIIGMDVNALDRLSDDFRVQPVQTADFQDWKKLALDRNPEIDAQRYAVEATRQDVNRNRAGHAPRLDAVAALSKSRGETLNTFNQESTVRTVGIQLNIPLYSGGYVNASTNQSVANYEKAKSDLDAKINQILVELGKQHSLVLSGASKIDALVKSVNSAKLVVTATEQSIKGGVRINLDLLNAQQQLFAAKRDLALARYNYLLSYLRLRNAAGTLTTDDLRTVAGYFVPGGGYQPVTQAAAPKPMAAHLSAQAAQSAQTVRADAAASASTSAAGASKPETKNKASANEELLNVLAAWTKAWSARDVQAYLGFYANDFKPGDGHSHEAWAKERAARIQRHARISVKSESPEVAMDGDRATVKFRQIYKSDRLVDDSRKTLVLAKQDGAWKITGERSE